jgi:flagellar biosynthesis/type III secretory pathway protein FliH
LSRVHEASNYGSYQYSRTACEQGYQDGLYTGANDGRRGQSYDPERSHFYQHGASGFRAVFGSPETYKEGYRDGFTSGYDEGYQNYEQYFVGGSFRP